MASEIKAWDYVVLGVILMISVFIGLYHGFRQTFVNFLKNRIKSAPPTDLESTVKMNNEQSTTIEALSPNNKTSEYLMANASMKTLPIAFSLLASVYSASSLLGMPAEVYQYGIQFWIVVFSQSLSPIIGAFVTVPFFAKFKVLSIFEYFEMRFGSRSVRLVGTVCYLLRSSISCAIFMYGPATSLALLINLDEKVCIGMIGFIGTFYTTIGGIKGVIWNDLFQALIMFVSLIIIIAKGVYDVGGFSNLWEINANGGRLNLFNFNPDPFIRQSFWSLIFGQMLLSSMSFCFDQIMIQRFLAAKTKKIAQRALLLNSPGIFLLVSLCCFVGLCLYANFFGCDPLTHTDPSKRIRNPNQLVGYFVINNLNEIPGMAGFFLASIFCGSLSSLSSYLNSQAAIIWQDFFKFFQYFRDFEDAKSLRMNKLIVLACGIVSTGFAFLISSIGSNLNQISISLNGALNAPILGLFLLGMFFSVTNSVGVIMGAAAGLAAGLWLSIGAYVVKPIYPKLDTSTELCPNQTILVFNNKTLTMANDLTGLDKFYSLSYMWYMPIGVLVTLIVGLIFSIFTGGLKNRQQLEEKKSFIYYDLVWFCSYNK